MERKYEIVDITYFNSLSSDLKKAITLLRKALLDKKCKITGASPAKVDIIKMIKEGALFKKYRPSSVYNKVYMAAVARCFGLKVYYIHIRLKILGLSFKAINLYYEDFIQFFDIQQLIHFDKQKQDKILDGLLGELTIDSKRSERVKFFNKHYTTTFTRRKRYHTVKEEEKPKQDEVRVPPMPGDIIVGGNKKLQVLKIPVVIEKTTEKEIKINQEALEIAGGKKSEKRNIKELQQKRIKEQNQKIEEMRKFMSPPKVVTAESLKKDVPKNEQDFYNNYMDMIIPEKENMDDWKKKNGY